MARLPTRTAAEPSLIWLEDAAVMTPSGLKGGRSCASFSSEPPRRGSLVGGDDVGRPVGRRRGDREDLAREATFVLRTEGAFVTLEREGV